MRYGKNYRLPSGVRNGVPVKNEFGELVLRTQYYSGQHAIIIENNIAKRAIVNSFCVVIRLFTVKKDHGLLFYRVIEVCVLL